MAARKGRPVETRMLCCIDFESEAIAPRPNFPPKPVGMAVYLEGQTPCYLSWGHPEGNNCPNDSRAKSMLAELFAGDYEFVFHNAPFDCAIIAERLELQVPWHRVHDTMLMAFLHDPYGELRLKPLAEKYLGEPPEERDAVRQWLVEHRVCAANAKDWGAHISKAPASIVEPYAIGDVTRTMGLYRFFSDKLRAKGMA